jgi:hypothetical protein
MGRTRNRECYIMCVVKWVTHSIGYPMIFPVPDVFYSIGNSVEVAFGHHFSSGRRVAPRAYIKTTALAFERLGTYPRPLFCFTTLSSGRVVVKMSAAAGVYSRNREQPRGAAALILEIPC